MEGKNAPEGIIFDCDGTLADTMPLHFRAWQEALRPYNVSLDEALFYDLGGVPSPDIVRELNRRNGLQLSPRQVSDEKEAVYIQILPEAQPIECVVELVHHYRGSVPMAVASGGIRPLVLKTLQALGIEEVFHTIATAEDVTRGKPAPDLFLFAAERMGVSPEACVVYEDSPLGLEAARRAGMTAIDVRTLIDERRQPGPPAEIL